MSIDQNTFDQEKFDKTLKKDPFYFLRFLERQQDFQRKLRRMYILYALGIVATIIAFYLLISIFFLNNYIVAIILYTPLFFIFADKAHLATDVLLQDSQLWQLKPFIIVSVVVGTSILFSSWRKYNKLSQGGSAVAEDLGCRRLRTQTLNLQERKLRNVVEELSIAANIPPPDIYVIENYVINAFAAGYSIDDSVVAVSRGALTYLTRDELQGVVAHEIAHIYNKDIRIRTHLICLSYGFMFPISVGTAPFRGLRTSLEYTGNDNPYPLIFRIFLHHPAGFLFFLFAIASTILGAASFLIGLIIQFAVSRLCEARADIHAIEFSRDPLSLASALKKVGNFAARERFFNTPQEFTPIFFAEPRRSFFQKIFSTHPPLTQRIKALDPSFDGHFSIAVPKAIDEDKGYILELEKESTQGMKISSLDIKTLLPWCYIFDFKTADEILSTIPVETLEAISKPSISISLIFAILLEKYDQEIHKTQTGYILTAYDLTVLKETQRLYVFVYELNRTQKLLLASISIASLKEMNKTQFKIFNSVIKQIISADKKINLLEFCLVKTIKNTLASRLSTTIKKIRNRHLNDFPNECAILLSILARAETDKEDEVQKAFDAGVKELNLSNSLQLVSRDVISNKGLGEVMDKLDSLTEKDRLSLYCACGTVVNSNHRLCEEEADLMRLLQSALQVN